MTATMAAVNPLSGDFEELRQRHLSAVTATAAALAWLAGMRFASFNSRWERTWPVVLSLLAGITVSLFLRRRHFHLAASALTLGMTLALVSEAWLVPGPLVPYLLPALVVLVVGLSLPEGVMCALLSLAGLALVDLAQGREVFGQGWQLATLGVLAATAAAVTSSRQFQAAFAWARSATLRAEHAARDAHRRREELVKANQALRNAYYLLERTNHALAEAQAELVEARRLKTEFVNTVSHELRAPLNFIVGFSELMVNSPDVYGDQPWPEGLRQDLEEIHRSSSHLSRLIDDILDLAQIEAQRMALKREFASLAEIAREAASMVSPWLERKGLELVQEYDPDLPNLYVDRTRIRQVMLNLLNNAVRFTDHGRISVRVGRVGHEAVIEVADTGVGINPEQLPNIFQDFVQLDSGRGRAVGGFGLGLAICRRFVEMHGGRIWADSQPGCGSTFHVALPLSTQAAAVTRTDSDSLASNYWDTLHKQAAAPEVVLYVGPERDAELVRKVLECEVVHASAADIGSLVEALRPRAILVAGEGGELGAVEAAMDSSPHDVPVLALTLAGTEALSNPLGANAHLTKPITQARLMQKLQEVCPGARRILVVDDDPRMQHLLSAMLQATGKGYKVESVGTASEALEALHRTSHEVVLLDLRLPDIDGVEVLKSIRTAPSGVAVPVITMSAYLQVGDELTVQRQSVRISCRRHPAQAVALLRTAMEQVSPRFSWEMERTPSP